MPALQLASSRKLALLAALFLLALLFVFWQTSYFAGETQLRQPSYTSNDADKLSHEKSDAGRFSNEGLHETSPESAKSQPDEVGGQSGQGTASSSTYIASPTSNGAMKLEYTAHASYDQIQAQIQDLRKGWNPPQPPAWHWPPYKWYTDRDYDPNLWEGFDWDNDFYINNGVKQLPDAEPFLPYPNYNSPSWNREWRGEFVPCEGARGKRLDESPEDVAHAYPALPAGFPQAAVGSADAIGIDANHCFDRCGRFGAYGHGKGRNQAVADCTPPKVEPQWESVHWQQLQNQCLIANRHRYRPMARRPISNPPDKDMPLDSSETPGDLRFQSRTPHYHHRTALLIRGWTGYEYTANDLQAIRALITELSLLSGAEYQVFLLVNVQDHSRIWKSKQAYQDVLDKYVPPELHGITILWSGRLLEEWYPVIGDWQVYWHQFMPLQWFSKLYPEFDFVWNWETDARYTGNHYNFFEQVAAFAKNVPRKHLWERNARFCIPAAHGTYEQFLNDTDATIEDAVRNRGMQVVWGPQPYNKTVQQPIGPTPPHSLNEDNFQWGVGEEADLITLQPIWDPTHTWWTYRDKIWNYVPGVRPHFTQQDPLDVTFTHPDFVKIPRRTYINTVSRFSRKLLHAMHLENDAGRTMQAEMWPASVALQHGLKAVYAPHPIWTDHHWPPWYMDAVFNADGNDTARWGARADSVYNQDREHNFNGWSWYFASSFPRNLYHRWLGWFVTVGSKEEAPNNPLRALGGKSYEKDGFSLDIPAGDEGAAASQKIRVGGNGKMCLPPMLLHPVKNVYEDADAKKNDGGYEGFKSWLKKWFQ